MQINLISVLNPIFLASLTENIVIMAAGKAMIATGIVLYFCFIIILKIPIMWSQAIFLYSMRRNKY